VASAEGVEEVKSVGHSMTLEQDIDRRKDILKYLLQLSEMVGRRARRYGVAGRTVHLSVRFADFSMVGKRQSRKNHMNQSNEIFNEAVSILDTLELHQPVRLLGISITNLCRHGQQIPLFEDERMQVLATSAMDEVNDRYGSFAVTYGSVLDNEEKGSFVISPAWRPDGIRNVEVQ
jgi:DNA polymerase-4